MRDHNRYASLTDEQIADQVNTLVGNTTLLREVSKRLLDREDFLVTLDGMIESTEEFIGDDGWEAARDEGRLEDLVALMHVRKLWDDIFKPTED